MRVLCFGDSNTYGYDPRSFFGERYAPGDRWPELLAEMSGWDVVNLGANGRGLVPAPDIALELGAQLPADILIIMLGTNDLLQGADAAVTAARMEVLLTGLPPRCGKVILAAPPALRRGAWVGTDELAEESRRLAAEYERLAQRLNVCFIDTGKWDLDLCYDGVHLTQNGHHVFAERLFAELCRACKSAINGEQIK